MNINELAFNSEFGQISKSSASEHLVETEPDKVLNLGNSKCPILGLKSMKALRSLKPGQTIEITTISGARKALRRVSWMTGAKIIAVYEEDGQFKHLLRKES